MSHSSEGTLSLQPGMIDSNTIPFPRRPEGWDVAAHLDLVLNSLSDHAILTLDPAGNITSWNAAAAKTKGYQATEIIGRHFSVFYTQADQDAGKPEEALRIANESDKYETEGWRVKKSGETFWASLVLQPLKDETGKLRGYVKVTRDISEKMRIDALQNQLHRSQKLELVGQLVGGVAHDFNNLLTSIEGTFELIGRQARDEKTKRILEINRVAVERSQKLVAQLLAFSRKQTLSPKAVDLNQVIAVFNTLLERTIGELIELRWDLAPNLPAINVDAGFLQSSLLNLVVNAKDAMPDGGILTIFSKAVEVTAQQAGEMEIPPGRYITLGVTDTGRGMTSAVKEKAIEPFFTTKDIGHGAGLGLSQCYGYARQSGGTLTIDTAMGKGSTISLYFPAQQAVIPDSKNPKRTILLVEDEDNVRMITAEVLRAIGHIVIEAADAHEALSKLKSDVPIDYLFTDIILPNGINGVQLAEMANELHPDLKTVLASGYPRDALRETVKLKNNVVFLQKPYNIRDLSKNFGNPAAPEFV